MLLESALEDAAGEVFLQRNVDSHRLGLYGLGEVDYAELVLGHWTVNGDGLRYLNEKGEYSYRYQGGEPTRVVSSRRKRRRRLLWRISWIFSLSFVS